MNLDTWLLNNHVKRVHDLSNLPIAKLQELAGVVQAEIRHKQLEQKRQESAKIETDVKFKGEEYRKYSGFWWIGDTIGRVGNPLLIRDLNEIYLAQVNK